jgi:hypothetical protein
VISYEIQELWICEKKSQGIHKFGMQNQFEVENDVI